MPEVEIDIDDLLEVTSDDERAIKLQVKRVALCVLRKLHFNTEFRDETDTVHHQAVMSVLPCLLSTTLQYMYMAYTILH